MYGKNSSLDQMLYRSIPIRFGIGQISGKYNWLVGMMLLSVDDDNISPVILKSYQVTVLQVTTLPAIQYNHH